MSYADGGYRKFVRRLPFLRPGRARLRTIVGGHFEAFGVVQREMLRHYGLEPRHALVDVGCGAGRLSVALRGYLEGPYLGTDVVPDLVREARIATARPDWRFETVAARTIPAPAASADLVCFFSVFTHLLHEHTYLYLAEAKRVLRPGGKIVFSFLDYASEPQWTHFERTVENARAGRRGTLNVFIGRDAIAAWARHLDLAVEDVRDGADRFVPLPEPVVLDDGTVMRDYGCLGQSVCVLALR